jgi:hypothetical protein
MTKKYIFQNKDPNYTQTRILCNKKYECTDRWTGKPIEMSRGCINCDWATVEKLDSRDKIIGTIKKANPPMTYSEYIDSLYKKRGM